MFFASRRVHWGLALLISSLAPALAASGSNSPSLERPRVVVLTDYYKDTDEIQAMVRFLTYANSRWSEAISRDFAARLDWHVKPRAGANHPPVAIVEGDATRQVLQRTVIAGDTVSLDAAGSSDPDSDALSFKWRQYVEPGRYRGPLTLRNSDTSRVTLVAPEVSQPETVHLILTVTDRGEPQLTGYRRVIVTITPAGSTGRKS